MGWNDDPDAPEDWGHGDADVGAPVAAPGASRKPMGVGEAVAHGGVEAIPFGQKATALLSAGGLRLIKAMSSEPWSQQLDDTYAGQLARERGNLEQAEKDQKWPTRGGKLLGGAASMAAMSPLKAAQGAGLLARTAVASGNAGLYGVAHGAGTGDTLADAAKGAALEGTVGLGAGAAGHLLLGEAVPALASGAADKARGLAAYLQSFANKRAVKATMPMLKDYRGMAAQGRIDDMGQALLDNGIVTFGAKPETILSRATAMERSKGEEIGKFLDDLKNLRSTTEDTYNVPVARTESVPFSRQEYTGWKPAEETQRVWDPGADHTAAPVKWDSQIVSPRLSAQRHVMPDGTVEVTEHLEPQFLRTPAPEGRLPVGATDYTNIRPEPQFQTVHGTEERLVPGGWRAQTDRTVVDKFQKTPVAERIRSEVVPQHSGELGRSGLASAAEKYAEEMENLGGGPGDVSFTRANQSKARLSDLINFNRANPSEAAGNELKRQVRGVLNSEIERQADAMLTQNNVPPEVMRKYLADKALYGHLSQAEETLADALSRREANRLLSPSDHGVGLTSFLAGTVTGHPIAGGLMGVASAVGNKFARERGSAAAASTASALARALRAAPEAAAGVSGRALGDLGAAVSIPAREQASADLSQAWAAMSTKAKQKALAEALRGNPQLAQGNE